MHKKKLLFISTMIFVFMMLSACAPGKNVTEDIPNQKGKVAGFFKGLWHGIIAPITFIISIFTDRVNVYEIHNSGFWYNLGFLLAVGGGSGGGAAACSSRRR